jgi:hypothetical protein
VLSVASDGRGTTDLQLLVGPFSWGRVCLGSTISAETVNRGKKISVLGFQSTLTCSLLSFAMQLILRLEASSSFFWPLVYFEVPLIQSAWHPFNGLRSQTKRQSPFEADHLHSFLVSFSQQAQALPVFPIHFIPSYTGFHLHLISTLDHSKS